MFHNWAGNDKIHAVKECPSPCFKVNKTRQSCVKITKRLHDY